MPIANAHSELIAGFCDDLFDPKSAAFVDAFSRDELLDLCHLYGLLMEARSPEESTASELLKRPEWRRVIEFA